jgi:selenocysteine lyase/cysteine desulfurase
MNLPLRVSIPLGPDEVVGARTQVPVLDGTHRRYVNLDNAASTPALRSVAEAVAGFLGWYSSVHRGAGFKSRLSTEAYEASRETVRRFVGGNARDHVVIFGKNATEAINKLAHRLPLGSGDVVLVSTLEHHSNDLPWRPRAHVEHIHADAAGALDEAHFDWLLARHAGRVRLVAVTGGSNVTGNMPDIHGLAAKAHAAGAEILVDCAQLAPHRAIDMRALGDPAHLDYVALSAHKMYAPFGTGALIGRADTFAQGAPEYCGGGTVEFVGHDCVAWAHAPERDEAGSPNVIGAVALAAAIEALEAIGMDTITSHEADLTAYALARLGRIPGLRLYGDPEPRRAAQRLGVVPFTLDGVPHGLVAAILSSEFGIGVRNGCFCAHPYLTHLLGLTHEDIAGIRSRIAAGDRRDIPGLVRASFGSYNTVDDVDTLADGLESIAASGPRGHYAQDAATGDFAPAEQMAARN